jgi:hypothetical protein
MDNFTRPPDLAQRFLKFHCDLSEDKTDSTDQIMISIMVWQNILDRYVDPTFKESIIYSR